MSTHLSAKFCPQCCSETVLKQFCHDSVAEVKTLDRCSRCGAYLIHTVKKELSIFLLLFPLAGIGGFLTGGPIGMLVGLGLVGLCWLLSWRLERVGREQR